MELYTKTLDVFFRRIAPETVLEGILLGRIADTAFLKECFLSRSESTLSGYSREEKENIFEASLEADVRSLPPFWHLRRFSEEVLTDGSRHPLCRFDKVMLWRDTYLLLGQDIFTTAWLAGRPRTARGAVGFAWPAVLQTDDTLLNSITQELAENHMHLYAGASVFSLSWCCLMNHPDEILKEGLPEILLQAQQNRGASDVVWTMRRKTIYAACLRTLLFRKLRDPALDIAGEFRRFHDEYFYDEWECVHVKGMVDRLRYRYGIAVQQPSPMSMACLDYALTRELSDDIENDYRLLAGERFLLYGCFQAAYLKRFSPTEQWLFYLYLLLKAQLRGEFVQVNGETGFYNFSRYDDRKKVLWKNYAEYRNEDYRQALVAPRNGRQVTSLEARVSPEPRSNEMLKKIHSIDKAALFFGTQDSRRRSELSCWPCSLFAENKAEGEGFFYVLHFPKERDVLEGDPLKYRHFRYRHEILRATAVELAKALSNSAYLRERIRGIDACANEIGCRPEVFADAFRFLRVFPSEHYRYTGVARGLPRLALTYHVGEDFLDLTDGLRAIDEAITFLDMRCGDRLGHALALGVEPRLHYKRKGHVIVLSKQDLLDDLVWFRFRSRQLNVRLSGSLIDMLDEQARELFDQIYGSLTGGLRVNLMDYYHSMLLRGDRPDCYRGAFYKGPNTFGDPFDACAENSCARVARLLQQYRAQDVPAMLCHLYQYDKTAYKKGAVVTTMRIEPEYVAAITAMQSALRELVNDCGIRVECNPSSNVLIGTFDAYANHPVFRFNGGGLHLPFASSQMHVSVNSDDPGVFDTSLPFEYALLAGALSGMRDEDGRRLHTDREIENYLRKLARMGREQSFP